jgi:hypothetical protein
MQGSAKGMFEIQARSRETSEVSPGLTLGKIRFDKQFSGDLSGTSVVEMMSVGTAVQGSAGYVAMECVAATLAGRTGTFLLQHSGLMARGVPTLSVIVVPDSGTGELRGLAGSLTIDIVEKQHFYTLNYELPEKSAEL